MWGYISPLDSWPIEEPGDLHLLQPWCYITGQVTKLAETCFLTRKDGFKTINSPRTGRRGPHFYQEKNKQKNPLRGPGDGKLTRWRQQSHQQVAHCWRSRTNVLRTSQSTGTSNSGFFVFKNYMAAEEIWLVVYQWAAYQNLLGNWVPLHWA